jgi:dipeptidase E
MKQKLLLTSQGLPKGLENVFISALGKSPQKSNVSFVTTAAYGDKENPKWLEFYKKQLNSYDIRNIEELDFRHKTQRDLKDELSDKDVIFVNGGNAFYLLHWVRKSGFDKLLPKLLEKDKLYVGVSAGSYIACPTIEAATWKHPDRNKIGLKDLNGMNLVPFLITAHFDEKNRHAIEKASKTTEYPIVALYDTQAVFIEDNSYKVVGKGKKEFFNGFEES